jgi:hypothetical protein
MIMILSKQTEQKNNDFNDFKQENDDFKDFI